MNDFERNLNDLLVDTFYSILKFEESALNQILSVDVTISEAHMIEAVSKLENAEATVSNIAFLLAITVPTVTVAIKKLENKGLVQKIPCSKDARRTIIRLTDQGRKIDKVHQLFHAKMVRNISEQFLDNEKDILLRAIDKLSEFFKDKTHEDGSSLDDGILASQH